MNNSKYFNNLLRSELEGEGKKKILFSKSKKSHLFPTHLAIDLYHLCLDILQVVMRSYKGE